MTIGTISPRDAKARIEQGARLIDIRDADEYLREHIPQAHLAPLSTLEQGAFLPGCEVNASFSIVSPENERKTMRLPCRLLPHRLKLCCWKGALTAGKRRVSPRQKINHSRFR